MNMSKKPVDPERLVEAAIEVMRVCAEYAQSHGGLSAHPADILLRADAPRSLSVFSKHEVEEATAFLVRMGYLEPTRKPA
jgi:hypothetical protein